MKGNQKAVGADSSAWGHGRRRDTRGCTGDRARWRSSSRRPPSRWPPAAAGPSSPQVASLGTSTSPGTSASPGTGGGTSGERRAPRPGERDPAAGRVGCLRAQQRRSRPGRPDHRRLRGDPHHHPARGPAGRGDSRATGPCSEYLAEAQNDLRAANPVAPPPDQAEHLKYVACMRANGVPDYPYPDRGHRPISRHGVDPNSPSVEKANQLCGKKIGAASLVDQRHRYAGRDRSQHGRNRTPTRTPPACFYVKNQTRVRAVTRAGRQLRADTNG